MTASQLRSMIQSLMWSFDGDPRIKKLKAEILKEREPEIERLKIELEEAIKQVKPKKRWPENTPQNIIEVCNKYWRGTTSFSNFRIHHWNDMAVWTSYPSGGYSVVAGWTSTPPSYHLISLTEANGMRPKCIKILSFDIGSGQRVTSSMMLNALDELTKGTTTP